jgi:hypothetical protein
LAKIGFGSIFEKQYSMKIIRLVLLAGLFISIACNSAQKAEAEKRRQQKKLEQMEKDREDFKRTNEKDLK